MHNDFPPTRSPARRFAMPVLTIAALAAAFALGFWILTSLQALETRGSKTDTRVDARLAALEAREVALFDAQEKLASQLAMLTGSRRDTLFAAEAEHLIRLAAQRLTLFQDPQGADAMLAAAERALREVRGADTHATLAALARDRAQLRDITAFNVEAAWHRLATLPDRVDQLTVPAAKHGMTPAATPVIDNAPPITDSPSTSHWDRLIHGIRSLVVLRRVDEPIAPALTADERALAADHFRLLIEQAQLALLQHRHAIYHDALQQASRQIERITTGDPLLRNRIQQEIATLDVLSASALPTFDESLAAGHALLARLSNASEVTP